MSTAHEAGNVVIAVADTGDGIEEEHIPHIFERFYRADSARTRVAGGSGLGLAIVRELVELMGGTISVESRKGEGSRFRVALTETAEPDIQPASIPYIDQRRPLPSCHHLTATLHSTRTRQSSICAATEVGYRRPAFASRQVARRVRLISLRVGCRQ